MQLKRKAKAFFSERIKDAEVNELFKKYPRISKSNIWYVRNV